MLYAAVLAGILCIAVLKTGGKEQSQTQTIVRPDYTDSADNIELEVLAEGEEKPFLVELEVSPRQYEAQQIEGIFDTVYEQILQEMVSGNESLSCVRHQCPCPLYAPQSRPGAYGHDGSKAVPVVEGSKGHAESE